MSQEDSSGNAFEAAPTDHRRTLLRAAVATFGASTATLISGVIKAKVMAVVIGPAGVGLVANLGLATSVAIGVAGAVAGQGAVRMIAEARARSAEDELRWLIPYVLAAPALVALLILTLMVTFAAPLATWVTGSPASATLLIAAGVGIPLGVLALSWSQVLQGFMRVGLIARAEAAAAVSSVIVGAAAILSFGLIGAVVALVATPALRWAFLMWYGRWAWSTRWRWPGQVQRRQLRPVLALGGASVLVGTLSIMGTLLIRSATVQRLGLEENGIYQPVSAISDTYLELLLASTALYLFPRLSGLNAIGDRNAIGSELGHAMRLLLVIAVPILILGIGFGEVLITTLYSGAFGAAEDTLALQMVGSAFKIIGWSIGAALLPLGYYAAWALIAVGNVAVKVVGSLMLIDPMGIDGLAVAYDVAWVWSAVASVVIVARARLHIPSNDWILATVAIGVTSLVAATALVTSYEELVASAALFAWVIFVRRDILDLIGMSASFFHRPVAVRKP